MVAITLFDTFMHEIRSGSISIVEETVVGSTKHKFVLIN